MREKKILSSFVRVQFYCRFYISLHLRVETMILSAVEMTWATKLNDQEDNESEREVPTFGAEFLNP